MCFIVALELVIHSITNQQLFMVMRQRLQEWLRSQEGEAWRQEQQRFYADPDAHE